MLKGFTKCFHRNRKSTFLQQVYCSGNSSQQEDFDSNRIRVHWIYMVWPLTPPGCILLLRGLVCSQYNGWHMFNHNPMHWKLAPICVCALNFCPGMRDFWVLYGGGAGIYLNTCHWQVCDFCSSSKPCHLLLHSLTKIQKHLKIPYNTGL